jgi:hypothetical protein
VLAAIRFFKVLRDREHYLRTRYHKDHPHFYLFLVLDAIVTILVSASLYNVAFGSGILDREPHLLMDMGTTAVDLREVKHQARDHKVMFYWIGEERAGTYSTEVTDPEKVILNYLSDSKDASGMPVRLLKVIAYPSVKSFVGTTKGPLHPTKDIEITNGRGDRVVYNESQLNRIEVTLAADESIVVLEYPRPQTISQLISDSEKIVPLI